MGKKDKEDELDKDSRKRLEKLDEQWDDAPGKYLSEKLTLADLRLLLEHHTPLQDLLRAIVTSSSNESLVMVAKEPTDLRKSTAEEDASSRSVDADYARMQSELGVVRAHCGALQNELEKCTTATQQLLQANGKLEKQLLQAQKELGACRAELTRSSNAPAELALLRGAGELAQRLELTDLPDNDTQALIRTVAVLSQMNNIERLWDTLKAACERESRPASAEETALLQTALDWHNHNWQKKPFALHRPGDGKHFDFSKEQRAAPFSGGETLSAVWLPGIVASNGTVQKKALVATR